MSTNIYGNNSIVLTWKQSTIAESELVVRLVGTDRSVVLAAQCVKIALEPCVSGHSEWASSINDCASKGFTDK